MKTTVWVFTAVLAIVAAVNTGRRKTSSKPEIAFGDIVDYATIKGRHENIVTLQQLENFTEGAQDLVIYECRATKYYPLFQNLSFMDFFIMGPKTEYRCLCVIPG